MPDDAPDMRFLRRDIAFGTTTCGRSLVVSRRSNPSVGDILRTLARSERRWLIRRILHDMIGDPRPVIAGILALALIAVGLLIPLAKGMPFSGSRVVPVLVSSGGAILALVAVAWWLGVARDSLVQHLLVLRRCGQCGHPEADRGLHLSNQTAFARRNWRCAECGAEWVASGAFADAETRREAA